MPICLPPNSKFRDTEKPVRVVGFGHRRYDEKNHYEDCFTDGTGPEVFMPCSSYYGKKIGGETLFQSKCIKSPPPNTKTCKNFRSMKMTSKSEAILKDTKGKYHHCYKVDAGSHGWCPTYKVLLFFQND